MSVIVTPETVLVSGGFDAALDALLTDASVEAGAAEMHRQCVGGWHWGSMTEYGRSIWREHYRKTIEAVIVSWGGKMPQRNAASGNNG